MSLKHPTETSREDAARNESSRERRRRRNHRQIAVGVDSRGVSNVIGAILALTVIALVYAGAVATIPQQIQDDTEFQHSRQVLTDMQELHASMQQSSLAGTPQQSVVTLGGQYPSYLIFPQPPGPSGTLYMSSTDYTVEIIGAEAVDSDIADYMDGSSLSFTTRSVQYEPNYKQYDQAPDTKITGSAIVAQYPDRNDVLGPSQVVQGRRLHLTSFRGSFNYGRTGGLRLQATPLSDSTDTIQVTNAGAATHIQIRIETPLPESVWREMLADQIDPDTRRGQPSDGDNQFIAELEYDTSTDPNTVILHLEEDVTYNLGMNAVGLTGPDQPPIADSNRPDPSYLTRVTTGNPTVVEENSITLKVRVRDKLNNPSENVVLEATSPDGTVATSRKTTNEDGVATFIYTAPSISADLDDVSSETKTVTVQVVGESGTLYQVQFDVQVQNAY